MYRSPNSNNDKFDKMVEIIKNIPKVKYRNTVIVGDFNFKNINLDSFTITCSENQMEYKFLECLNDTYMYHLVRQPTRYRENNKPPILDLVLSTDVDKI